VNTVTYVIDYQTTGAELCFSDFVSGDQLFEAKAKFFAHAFDVGARYVLCDFSEASKFDIPTSDVDRMVDQDRGELSRHPHLLEVVVAPQPLVYGLARMWQTKVNTIRPHTAVVRTRAEAVEWLKAAGVEPAPEHCADLVARQARTNPPGVRERV
jgi:hypothetical protein